MFLFPNEQHSNEAVSTFIWKTIYFILQDMLSPHTSLSVVHIKSAVNIQIINIQNNNFQNWYISIAILIVPSWGIFVDQKIPFLKITLLLNSPEKNFKSYLK